MRWSLNILIYGSSGIGFMFIIRDIPVLNKSGVSCPAAKGIHGIWQASEIPLS